MAWEKLTKPVKGFSGRGCSVKIHEEGDGVIVEFISAHLSGNIEGFDSEGVCAILTDPLGNFVGCQSVACSKKCCAVEDEETGEWGCSCMKKCPEEDEG